MRVVETEKRQGTEEKEEMMAQRKKPPVSAELGSEGDAISAPGAPGSTGVCVCLRSGGYQGVRWM